MTCWKKYWLPRPQIEWCRRIWRNSCNNSSHNLSWYVDFDLLALIVFFGVNHAKIWHRDHIMCLSYIVYRRLPALDWFVCCWCHYSYGRKPKAVSNLNFLLFLSCFSWWSSPGRLYEKTTLGMFQWASVIWGGEIIIIIITRPKPAYGRQGLAGSWGQDTDELSTVLVFLTSHQL